LESFYEFSSRLKLKILGKSTLASKISRILLVE
jgi:hypothetical protein